MIGLFVECIWAIGDGMFVDDGNGEVEVIPETIGVVGEWINVFGAIFIKLWLGMNLNKFEAESFGGELLGFGIRTITTTTE